MPFYLPKIHCFSMTFHDLHLNSMTFQAAFPRSYWSISYGLLCQYLTHGEIVHRASSELLNKSNTPNANMVDRSVIARAGFSIRAGGRRNSPSTSNQKSSVGTLCSKRSNKTTGDSSITNWIAIFDAAPSLFQGKS